MKFFPTLIHRQEDEYKLDFSRAHILALLHDTEAFFRMNPSVVNAAHDGPDSDIWYITDRVKTFIGETTTTYKAQMITTPSGFVAKSWASLGVHTTSSWAVVEIAAKEDGTPQSLLQINGTIEAPLPIFSFVKAQSAEIHKDTESRVRRTIEERKKVTVVDVE